MADDEARVMALIEEILNSRVTPEEACRDTPELLAAVRERLKRFRSVEAQVGEVFPPRKPSPGDEPFGRKSAAAPDVPGYEVMNVIGSGGAGVVYKARHLKLNRIVAIKMLIAGGYAGPRELERFKREAEAVAALRHPNIVQVYDAGELGGFPYFTMELLEGGTLAEALGGTPLPAKNAASLLAILARAVQAAHESGIVHRDLKPGNVLLAVDGTPKIADYGLAWRLEGNQGATITFEGDRLGTPSYMSPEQARGSGSAGAHAPTVDVYGLGTILYEMLTGRPPFRGESVVETQRQVLSDEPVPPARLNPRTPRDLQTICLKCLQKAPGHRYATARELAEDLDRFGRDEPIAARPASLVERGMRWARRKPAVAGLIVTAVALLALGMAFGASSWRRETKHRADLVRWTASLDLATQFESEGKFEEARALLERLPEEAMHDLEGQIRSALAGLELVRKLDVIRNDRVALVDGRFDLGLNRVRADPKYETAIADAGVGRPGDDPVVVAARMSASPIRKALVAAMDDWAICAREPDRLTWVFEVARRADPDPTGWRDRVRVPGVPVETLLELAASTEVKDQSPQLLVALAQRIHDEAGDAAPFLRQVVLQYPRDFWANFALGQALYIQRPDDAVRYFQVALAMHPDQPSIHHNLAGALAMAGQIDDAIKRYEEAYRLDKRFTRAIGACAELHVQMGHGREAYDLVRQAVAIDSDSADVFISAGAVYDKLGLSEAAVEAWRRAAELAPRRGRPHLLLAGNFTNGDRLDEAQQELDRARIIDPKDTSIHLVSGRLLKRQGRIDEAIGELEAQARLPDRVFRFWAHLELGDCWKAKRSPQHALLEYNKAVELFPGMHQALQPRRCVMVQLGMGEEVRAEWRESINPESALPARQGFAELCLYLGHQDAYEQACHDLLDRFPNPGDAMVSERVGKACLVGVLSREDTARAARLVAQAVNGPSPDWLRPYIQVARAMARYREGEFADTASLLQGKALEVLGPLPHLVLSMALARAGRSGEALRSYATAVRMFDWSPARAEGTDAWICHVVRREAEPLVMPNLPALLEGREKPRDQDERLALDAVCKALEQTARAAGIYAGAFKTASDSESRRAAESRRPESR